MRSKRLNVIAFWVPCWIGLWVSSRSPGSDELAVFCITCMIGHRATTSAFRHFHIKAASEYNLTAMTSNPGGINALIDPSSSMHR